MTKEEIRRLIARITASDKYNGFTIEENNSFVSDELIGYNVKIRLSNKYDYNLDFFHEFKESSRCNGLALRCECNQLYMMLYYFL